MRNMRKLGAHLGIYLVAFAMPTLFPACLGGRSARPAWGPGLAFSEALNQVSAWDLKSPRSASPGPDATGSQKVKATFARLPLSFIPNRGQVDNQRVRFYGHSGSASFFFARDEVVYSFIRRGEEDSLRKVSRSASEEERGHRDGGAGEPGGLAKDHPLQGKEKTRGQAVKIRFVGANPDPVIEGREELPGKANYFTGSDPAGWKQGLPTYGQIRYRELWPGIDLIYRGQGGRLKYEFVVKPEADPKQIRLAYRGIEGLSISDAGDLILQTASGELRDSRPIAYQEIGEKRVEVEAGFVMPELQGGGQASNVQPSFIHGFRVKGYNPAHPLILDPGLEYSTFLGGSSQDWGFGIALDSAGNAYVTGLTFSSHFPTIAGAFDTSHNGAGDDAFVAKLNSAGSALLYSTFLGGSSQDWGFGIALDGAGNAYVTGTTQSSDFPTTAGAFDTSYNGYYQDTFVVKLNANGSALLYATFLGGTNYDYSQGIALDGTGNAYVTGYTDSSDFPTSAGAYDTSFNGYYDAFVAKLNSTGSGLLYATFLGGSYHDYGYGIALDASGNAYVTGTTQSSDFPTTAGAFDTSYNGYYQDTFVVKLNANGSALLYATFLGGSYDDFGNGIALDASGNAYVTGYTDSSDFPTTAGAYDTSFNGSYDAFVAKLNSNGSGLLYATFLGGSYHDFGNGIALDVAGNAYVTGETSSSDFPTTAGAFDTSHNGSADAFVAKLNSNGSALLYSTFLGGTNDEVGNGIALDASGNAYVTGYTGSSDFPTTAGAFDTSFNGSSDAFVAKLATQPAQSQTGNYHLRILAKKGDTIGGYTLTGNNPYDISWPSLNNNGLVAFRGTFDGGVGIFTQNGVLAKTGDTIGGRQLFSIPTGELSINDNGIVAFPGQVSGLGSAILTQNSILVEPGVISGKTVYGASGPSLNNSGLVAFLGSFDPGWIGIFTQNQLIAGQGDVLFGKTIQSVQFPSLNDSGTVAFYAYFGPNEEAILTQNALIAETGDTIGGKTIWGLSAPSLNNQGDVAFSALFDNETGIFTQNALLVEQGDVIDGKIVIPTPFSTPSMNNNGEVAFHAFFSSVDKPNGGSGIFSTARGLVASTSDSIEGMIITSLSGGLGVGPSLNDSGSVAFLAALMDADNHEFYAIILADPIPPTVSITATDATATEAGATTGTFTVSRTGSTAAGSTVNYTVSGTATPGSDYGALSGSIVIPAGSASATLTVTPINDALVEGDETVIATLSANAAYTVGAPNSATVTIISDDVSLPTVTIAATDATATEAGPTTGTFTVSRTGSTASALTVNYTSGGTATNGSDYGTLSGSIVIPAGSSSATLTVTPINDALVEGDEAVIATLSANAAYTVGAPNSATVTIISDDVSLPTVTIVATDATATEAGLTTGTFTVSRTGSTAAALTVNYELSGSATNGSDYNNFSDGGVTIPAGSATATLTVTPIDDALMEGDETVVVTLYASTFYTVGSPGSAIVTIISDDVSLPTVTIVATDATATEAGPTTGTFTVSRTGSTAAALTVNYTISGTATPGSDYGTLSGSIVIPAGSSSTSLTVTPINDALVEGDETVIATLSSNAAYTVGTPNSATITMISDDVKPICDIQMSKASYFNGETVTAQVLRIANPTAASLAVELKLWFDVPAIPPVSFKNIGANGGKVLPAGFEQNFGPLSLTTVTDAIPRGTYGLNCRILHPVSGKILVEDLNPFDIR